MSLKHIKHFDLPGNPTLLRKDYFESLGVFYLKGTVRRTEERDLGQVYCSCDIFLFCEPDLKLVDSQFFMVHHCLVRDNLLNYCLDSTKVRVNIDSNMLRFIQKDLVFSHPKFS